jgi:tetratricopeptide (TPR) repeat protein
LSAFSTRVGVRRSPSRSGSSPSSASSFRISSCICLFYISLSAAPAVAQEHTAAVTADALYADRANLESARRAAAAWMADLGVAAANGRFEPAWKLARVSYWLGGHVPGREGRAYYERGIEAARTAAASRPNRPEGHFWLAANMGALAEASGLVAGLRYRGAIKRELETVLRLDPAFMSGSADRALGRWYHKVPGLFGGSRTKAEAHLRASLKYDPHSTVSHYFLAEVLLDEDRHDEARAELQRVLDSPLNREWAPEDADYKERARRLLASIR